MEQEPSFTKLYIKHLLFILVGVLPLALVWNVQNKWIAAPVGIISVLFVLAQLSIINAIADRQLAQDRQKRAASESHLLPASALKQKIVYNSLLVLFLCLTFLIGITGKKVANDEAWELLLIKGLKLLWIPFVIAWLYYKRFRVIFTDKEKEDFVTLCSFMIPLLILFHGLIWYTFYKP